MVDIVQTKCYNSQLTLNNDFLYASVSHAPQQQQILVSVINYVI